MDDRLRQMMTELESALAEAIGESPRVTRALQRLREERYSLYLLVREQSSDPIELKPAEPVANVGDPVFKIDGDDLVFLRSLGIDPTRKLRRRKTP